MRGPWNSTRSQRRSTRPSGSRPRTRPGVEELEAHTQPSILIGGLWGNGFHHHAPATGDTPSQILQAYGFNQLNISEPGLGQTIAIVDAYESPNIQSDLATFDAKYNLPAINLNVINDGATSQDPSGGWELEAALDVEWAHAVAPYANIVLVEAADDSVNSAGVPTNLLHAVSVAATQPNVTVVSMSWGVPEFASETQYDSYFAPWRDLCSCLGR